MKNKVVVDMLKSKSNARVVDFIMQAHEVDHKATRSSYQKNLNILKVKLKTLKKKQSREGPEKMKHLLKTDFVFPTKAEQPSQRKKNSGTQTLISGSTPTRYIQSRNKVLETRIARKNKELKRKSSQITHLIKKNSKLEEKLIKRRSTVKEITKCEDLKEMVENTEQKLKDTVDENEWLREMVQNDLVTKDNGGNFTVQMKDCVCQLLSCNVSTGQIPAVVESVLKLASKKATDLPCKTTINDWNVMRRSISQQQLAEEMPQKTHMALLSDETSKYGQKFEGFHAADESGRMYVLGLRNIASKSGKDVLSTLQQILRDIEDQSNDSQNDVSKQILLRITSTMSDRASTQIKFNELLEEYRKTLLPAIVDNYETLSEEECKSLGKLCNFFCGLHALVHLAETASASLVQTDNANFQEEPPIMDKNFRNKKEPGATRLVRTACKAIAEGGDEKSGCHGSFLEFLRPTLKEQGFRSLPIQPFRGNRFNILFQNAASTFYLAEHIEQYLEGAASNKLLKAVLFDIKIPEYQAGCKALGLVSFLVTVPLWASIEDSTIHVLDIGTRYQEVIHFLMIASNRSQEFISGDLHLSFSNLHALENSVIYCHLIKPWDHDDKVDVILQVMLPAMARLLQRIFSDHLEGGEWSDVSAEERTRLIVVPKHNKYSESIFGHLDRIMKEKPNISAIASEACSHIIKQWNGWMLRQQMRRYTFFKMLEDH